MEFKKFEELEKAEKIIRDAVIHLEQYSNSSNYTDIGMLVKHMDDAGYYLNAEMKEIPLENTAIGKPLFPVKP